jgi:uncharacterized protein
VLQLRPSRECCDRDLAPDAVDAVICSFECTLSRSCADTVLRGCCPNCGGELVTRPRRPSERLVRHLASTVRVFKPEGCAKTARL